VFSLHDPEDVASLLRHVGLLDVTAAVATATLDLGAPAEFLWQYINLTPMGPLVAQADTTAQEALEREVVESWQPFVRNGTMSINLPVVVASGRR
jgi:hypothetical protein